MSRFDKNPFDEDSGSNPYSDSAATTRPGSATASYFDNAVRPSLTPKGSASTFETVDLQKKEKELQAREQALKKREAELIKREDELGIERKNWPPFFPIIHHDIAKDIPEYLRSMQRWAYYSWLGVMVCLLWNFIAITAAWIDGAVSSTKGVGNFFLALIYLIVGPFGSYFLWYRRLYNSFRQDSALGFGIFFLGYLLHIAFFAFAAVAPPIFFKGASFAGVISTIDMFANDHSIIAIFYAIGSGLFIAEVVISVIVIGQVYAYFRGAGKATQMKREAAIEVARAAV